METFHAVLIGLQKVLGLVPVSPWLTGEMEILAEYLNLQNLTFNLACCKMHH